MTIKRCLWVIGICSLFFLLSFSGYKPMIIAHRGASAIAPENTKASYMLAWQMKAPAAECDIHLTSDKQIILMHDGNAKRTAGVDVNICDANYAELSLLDVGSFKDKKYAGERIPLLADILEIIPADSKFLIEIKCGTEILPYLEHVLNKSGKRSQTGIIGFNIDVVTAAKKLMPDIPTCWLVMPEKDKDNKWIPYSSELITLVKDHHLDGISVYWGGLNEEFVQMTHKAGLKIYVWTVDEPSVALQMEKMGVDGITTNKPDLIMGNISTGN